MDQMDITGMDVTVITNLYCAGMTEDGEYYTAETYSVLVEDINGNRWVHEVEFKGCSVETLEDGFKIFHDIRQEASKQAHILKRRVTMAQSINLDHWVEIDPAYGSIAFQQAHHMINQFGQEI